MIEVREKYPTNDKPKVNTAVAHNIALILELSLFYAPYAPISAFFHKNDIYTLTEAL